MHLQLLGSHHPRLRLWWLQLATALPLPGWLAEPPVFLRVHLQLPGSQGHPQVQPRIWCCFALQLELCSDFASMLDRPWLPPDYLVLCVEHRWVSAPFHHRQLDWPLAAELQQHCLQHPP